MSHDSIMTGYAAWPAPSEEPREAPATCVRLAATSAGELRRAWAQLCDELMLRYPARPRTFDPRSHAEGQTLSAPRRAHRIQLAAVGAVLEQALASCRPIEVRRADGRPAGAINELIADTRRLCIRTDGLDLDLAEDADHCAWVTSRAGGAIPVDSLEIYDGAHRRLALVGCRAGASAVDRGAWASLLAAARLCWPAG